MGRRAWAAWRARPAGVRDAWVTGALVLVAGILLARGRGDVDPVVATFVVLGTASLAWRRTAPFVTLAGSGVALGVTTALSGPGSGALAAVLIAVYSAVAWDRRLAGTVAAAVDVVVVAVVDAVRTGAWWGEDVVVSAMLVAVVLAAGFAVGSRRSTLEAARDRVERAERTREAEAARRVAEERLRIARELHDVLGHHVAVIGVQAGVAETLLVSRPEAARAALEHVQEASGNVLTELAALVEVLREPGDDPATSPTPGLEGLDGLLEDVRSTGLVVDVAARGAPRPLAPVVDLTAFRVVQEALTNAHKHGDGRAELIMTHAADALTIEVLNALGPEVPGGGRGYGLAGMRERVVSVGGTLDAGADARTFRVRAVLPVLAVGAGDEAAAGTRR
ncbi:sensor histidine kinase [Cellulomonas sp. P5_C6]